MPRFERYSDDFSGEYDERLRELLDPGEDDSARLRRVLLKVINNELTTRQKEIVMLYYFKGMSTVEIGKRMGITQQAASAVLVRARLRLFRILRYYI